MAIFITVLILLGLSLCALILQKAYYAIPEKELKRQARQGDELGKALYAAVSYGAALRLLLWFVIVASLAGSFVLLDQIVEPGIAFIVEAVIIGIGFAWLPGGDLSPAGARLATVSAPVIMWLLVNLHPVLYKVAGVLGQIKHPHFHTGLYEPSDLVDFLKQQKSQDDSRISAEQIELIQNVIKFDGKVIGDFMTPVKKVKMAKAKDPITPVVIRELHESGHQRFPVYDGKQDNIVGTLYLSDLVDLSHSGHVSDVMKHDVIYVHEERSLEQVLQAYIKTKHQIFVVVNNHEDYVGIITIDDILAQIIGKPVPEEFDSYDDKHLVAANELPPVPEPEPEPEIPEETAEEEPETPPEPDAKETKPKPKARKS